MNQLKNISQTRFFHNTHNHVSLNPVILVINRVTCFNWGFEFRFKELVPLVSRKTLSERKKLFEAIID